MILKDKKSHSSPKIRDEWTAVPPLLSAFYVNEDLFSLLRLSGKSSPWYRGRSPGRPTDVQLSGSKVHSFSRVVCFHLPQTLWIH